MLLLGGAKPLVCGSPSLWIPTPNEISPPHVMNVFFYFSPIKRGLIFGVVGIHNERRIR